jgi:hypothetical protein
VQSCAHLRGSSPAGTRAHDRQITSIDRSTTDAGSRSIVLRGRFDHVTRSFASTGAQGAGIIAPSSTSSTLAASRLHSNERASACPAPA